MSEARLEISIGTVKFSGEGSEAWLEKQFDKMLQKAPSIVAATPEPTSPANPTKPPKPPTALATFLKDKNTAGNQNRRFLAAAVWLKMSGTTDLKTSTVTKALADAHQQRLGNPADILNQQVSKGLCVKQGDGFYITPEGEAAIG